MIDKRDKRDKRYKKDKSHSLQVFVSVTNGELH